jgi:hypothetical protein
MYGCQILNLWSFNDGGFFRWPWRPNRWMADWKDRGISMSAASEPSRKSSADVGIGCIFNFFRSGRKTCLLKELVKLTLVPKWQTRMLLRYRYIDFWSSKRAKPKARVWKREGENSNLSHPHVYPHSDFQWNQKGIASGRERDNCTNFFMTLLLSALKWLVFSRL